MFALPSLPTLARTAALGGVVVIGAQFYFKGRIVDGIKRTKYYQESLGILRSHRGVAYLLGEPIRDGKINLGDNVNNFSTSTHAQFQVPVKGSKVSGTLYLWATCTPEQGWSVERLELGLKDDPGRRVLLKAPKSSPRAGSEGGQAVENGAGST